MVFLSIYTQESSFLLNDPMMKCAHSDEWQVRQSGTLERRNSKIAEKMHEKLVYTGDIVRI